MDLYVVYYKDTEYRITGDGFEVDGEILRIRRNSYVVGCYKNWDCFEFFQGKGENPESEKETSSLFHKEKVRDIMRVVSKMPSGFHNVVLANKLTDLMNSL